MTGRLAWSLGLLALLGCDQVIGADFNRGAKPAVSADPALPHPPDDTRMSPILPDAGSDAGTPPVVATTWDETQRALQAKRYPGPVTTMGSVGVCTDEFLVWRDGDGALHSWRGSDATRIDYTFKAERRPFFSPSSTFIAVDTPPTFKDVALYATDAPGTLKATVPYAYSFLATVDGLVRLDRVGSSGTTAEGTKVRRYLADSQTTVDVSAVLPTVQPPVSFRESQVVIPGHVNVPFALWIVNVDDKTTAQVTFDGAIGLHQAVPTTKGLLVTYARSGGVTGLRLYRDNQNDGSKRLEIGDELANTPLLFADSPRIEHVLLSRIAVYKNTVVYDSAFGLFAYDLDSGAVTPVQLGTDRKVFVTDLMCVLERSGLLVYRVAGDVLGQVWAVPIDGAR